MQLNITYRHFTGSDALKQRIEEKLHRALRWVNEENTQAHVVLSLEKHLAHADISVSSHQWKWRGHQSSTDMYASIELAVDKVERQIMKIKERVKKHHGKERVHHRSALLHTHLVPDHEYAHHHEEHHHNDSAARIVETTEFLAEPMTPAEAMRELDLRQVPFLVFTNADAGGVNVIYRKENGNYGLLDTSAALAMHHAKA